MRRRLCALLIVLLVAPPGDVRAVVGKGTIRGVVTVSERPVDGVAIALIEVDSGTPYRARSDAQGLFETEVPAGRYVLTAETTPGLVIARAPTILSVTPGQVVATTVALAAVAGAAVQLPPQTPPGEPGPPPAPVSSTAIYHDPIECMEAGKYPLVEFDVAPGDSVANARVYFKAQKGEEWFYVQGLPMAATGPEPSRGAHYVVKLPKPRLEAIGVLYYPMATTTTYGQGQYPESLARVVRDADKECKDRKVAPFGPPGEPVVFSASGAAAGVPGFALGVPVAKVAILSVLGLGGVATTIAALKKGSPPPSPIGAPSTPPPSPSPSPSPAASPSPSPTPTAAPPAPPTPTPTPSPTPTPTPTPTPSPSPSTSPSPSPSPSPSGPPPATPFR